MESIRLGQINTQELRFFPQNCFGFLGGERSSIIFDFLFQKEICIIRQIIVFLSFIFIILLNPTLKQFKNPLKVCQIKNSTWLYITWYMHIIFMLHKSYIPSFLTVLRDCYKFSLTTKSQSLQTSFYPNQPFQLEWGITEF